MSIGLVNVPFLSMINFSNTCGIGLNGAKIIKIAAMIRIEYGILSRISPHDFSKEDIRFGNYL